jgi:uncharacterized membrane protein
MTTELFTIPLSAGIIFATAGILLRALPPKKINRFYGYRTSSSMKSQERWAFAQGIASKELILWGSLLALSSTLSFLYTPTDSIAVICGLGLMIGSLVLVVLNVEKAISRKFDVQEHG